jgi:FkbM family methyltransferase
MKETLINNKYGLWLPEHRAARPEWATGWEVERIEHMLSNLTKGDIVFDIGVEEGDISALLARETGKIVLFEPNPRVWPNIKAIWETNKLPKPIGKFVGFAGNEDTYGRFEQPINKSTWPICAYGDLIGDHGFKELAYESDSIAQIKIDTFSHETGLVPDLITIDVEGSEFEVLKGARSILENHKPLVYVSVHPEFMFRMFNQYSAELFGYMHDLGYKDKVLAFDHEWHTIFYHD